MRFERISYIFLALLYFAEEANEEIFLQTSLLCFNEGCQMKKHDGQTDRFVPRRQDNKILNKENAGLIRTVRLTLCKQKVREERSF